MVYKIVIPKSLSYSSSNTLILSKDILINYFLTKYLNSDEGDRYKNK